MTSTTRRGGVFAATLALLVPLVGVGTAGPAAAHTELTSSTPTNGAALGKSPTTAKLVFSEPVKPAARGIALKSSAGQKASIGPVKATRNTLVVPIKGTLAKGGYLLSYSVVSADGHPVEGTIAFRVSG